MQGHPERAASIAGQVNGQAEGEGSLQEMELEESVGPELGGP